MIPTSTTRRRALNAGLAASLGMAALAGCQTPATSPLTGSQQAAAFPGTTGAQVVEGDTRRQLTSTQSLTATASASAANYPASRAVDGNTGTQWASGNVSNPTLTLDRGATGTLTGLAIKLAPGPTFAVDASDDNQTWKQLASGLKTSSWGVESKALSGSGRYVRLRFSGSNIQLFEATPQGALGAAPATTPTLAPTSAPTSAPAGTPSISASNTSGTFVAARAIDGNASTEWQSGPVSNPTLTLDRGASATLTGLDAKINPGITYNVLVSDDGNSWRTALSNQKNATWNSEHKALPAGTSGRFVRLAFSNGGKSVMVFELAVAASTPTSTPTAAPVTSPTTAPVTANGVAINVTPGTVLHAATSHILGTCRNHVAGQFPNGAAKLAKLKELTPTWGEHKYLYRIGHGPTDGRNDYSYMTGFHFEKTWDSNNSYPYDDVRNALADANTLGADQMHVVNFGTSDAAEAGRYVSFLNHAGDANRAAHPVAQQNVKMFEMGNEISWDIVRGHAQYAPNETAYAQRAKTFAQAMRKASDVPIQVGAVASTNSNWFGSGWSGGATTVKNILNTMGSDVDFLIYHGYPSYPMTIDGNLDTIIAQNEWNKQKLESEIKPAIKQYAGGRDVYIANTEFFSNLYSDATRSRGMFGAMYSADTLLLAMNEDIRTSVQFCADHGDMADASFFIGNDPNNTTAIFKFQKMLAQHWGDQIVATSGTGIPAKTVKGQAATIQMPKLSFSAATSGSKVYVMVLNRTNDADVTSAVNVGFKPSAVTAYTLAGTSGWDSANGDVTTSTPNLAGMTFKKASVTILEITR